MNTLIAIGAVCLTIYFNSELRKKLRDVQFDLDRLKKEIRRPRSAPTERAKIPKPIADVAPVTETRAEPASALSDTERGIIAQFLDNRKIFRPEVRQRMEQQLVSRFESRFPLEGRSPFRYLSDLRLSGSHKPEPRADDELEADELLTSKPSGEMLRTPARVKKAAATLAEAEGTSPSQETGEPDGPADDARRPDDTESETQPGEPAGIGTSSEARRDFETRVGTTWTLRVGLAAIAIAGALFARTIVPGLPPEAKVALAYFGAMGLFAVGMFVERMESQMKRFARPVMAGGLSLGFFVSFAAYFIPAMRAIPMAASLAWMTAGVVAVMVLATRWNSQSTAGLAIFLGHVSAFVAAGDAGGYSLVIIAFLSGTAVVLMHRNNWLSLSLFAVVAAYASHFLWATVTHDTIPLSRALVLNLSFLSSYYAIFLIGDLLWWRRKAPSEKDEAALLRRRVLGPANLVFYVSLVSFLYITVPGPPRLIEWFYFVTAAVQGALALQYRRLKNPDYGFYLALGTILLTLGFFAAFDALALNLILAFQALVLLLAAHRTRLRVFHLLAQLALGVNFFHYWTIGVSQAPTLPLFIGGLAIVAVYFTKSQLEEIWYGADNPTWKSTSKLTGAVRQIAERFDEGFAIIAPALPHLHAVAGAVILLREVANYFSGGAEFTGAVLALVVIASGSLIRRSIPLGLAYLVIQAGIVGLALEVVPSGLLPRMAVVAAGLGLPTLMSVMIPRRFAGAAIQRALGITQLGTWLAIIVLFLLVPHQMPSMPALVQYLLWIVIVGLVFASADRVTKLWDSIPDEVRWGIPGRALSVGTAVVGAMLITFVTQSVWGRVLSGPVWTTLWTVVLLGAAGWRRSLSYYAAAFTSLGLTYLYFLLGSELGPIVAQNIPASAFVIAVPLVLALAQDLLAPRYVTHVKQARVAVATYVPYGLASLFLAYVIGEWMDYPRATPALTALPLSLLVLAQRFALPRAARVAVIVMFVSLAQQGIPLLDGGAVFGMWPALIVAIAALIVQHLAQRYTLDSEGPVDRISLMLVVSGVGLAFIAVLRSPTLGVGGWTTVGWSLIAGVVIVAGFLLRSSIYRRVALGAFALSILRVFLVDVRGLSSGQQTLAFLILGVSLVTVAWLYARFASQVRKWL